MEADHFPDIFLQISARRTLEGTMSAEALEEVQVPGAHEVALQIKPDMGEYFEDHLLLVKERCKSLVKHLGRAAKLTSNATAHSTPDGRDAAVEAFLEDCYDLLDPTGIEEKIQYNRHVEEDFLVIENSYMGHLLVNDVDKFRSLVRTGPEKFVRELLEVADGMDVTITSTPQCRNAYEDLYAVCAAEVFALQHAMDDDVLLRVRRLLR